MTEFMTVDQIVRASRNDITNHIESGTFKKESEQCTDDDENKHTITSLYAQWGEDVIEAEQAISTLFEEEFPQYLN